MVSIHFVLGKILLKGSTGNYILMLHNSRCDFTVAPGKEVPQKLRWSPRTIDGLDKKKKRRDKKKRREIKWNKIIE